MHCRNRKCMLPLHTSGSLCHYIYSIIKKRLSPYPDVHTLSVPMLHPLKLVHHNHAQYSDSNTIALLVVSFKAACIYTNHTQQNRSENGKFIFLEVECRCIHGMLLSAPGLFDAPEVFSITFLHLLWYTYSNTSWKKLYNGMEQNIGIGERGGKNGLLESYFISVLSRIRMLFF